MIRLTEERGLQSATRADSEGGFVIDLAPNASARRPSGPSGPLFPRRRLRLVWSQQYRPAERRPRHLMLLAVLCFFLAGLAATGKPGLFPLFLTGDLAVPHAPGFLRAALAVLIVTGILLFVLGLTLLALEKGRRARSARLSAAGPSWPPARSFPQEEQR